MTEPFNPLPGVAYNDPPAAAIPAITGVINDALKHLGDGETGALVGIVTDRGVNGAIVKRLPNGWTPVVWIGKEWGEGLNYGAAVKKVWK